MTAHTRGCVPCAQPSAASVHGALREAIQYSRKNRSQQRTPLLSLVYGMGAGEIFHPSNLQQCISGFSLVSVGELQAQRLKAH